MDGEERRKGSRRGEQSKRCLERERERESEGRGLWKGGRESTHTRHPSFGVSSRQVKRPNWSWNTVQCSSGSRRVCSSAAGLLPPLLFRGPAWASVVRRSPDEEEASSCPRARSRSRYLARHARVPFLLLLLLLPRCRIRDDTPPPSPEKRRGMKEGRKMCVYDLE